MATRRNQIVAPQHIHDAISAHAHKAYAVKSWQNGTAPKTKETFYALIDAKKWGAESVFDAAHGFRYMLFVYSTREERKECWDCVTEAK